MSGLTTKQVASLQSFIKGLNVLSFSSGTKWWKVDTKDTLQVPVTAKLVGTGENAWVALEIPHPDGSGSVLSISAGEQYQLVQDIEFEDETTPVVIMGTIAKQVPNITLKELDAQQEARKKREGASFVDMSARIRRAIEEDAVCLVLQSFTL